jgi:hypothetical protein
MVPFCGVFEAYGWLPWVLDSLMLLSLWARRARRAVLCWLTGGLPEIGSRIRSTYQHRKLNGITAFNLFSFILDTWLGMEEVAWLLLCFFALLGRGIDAVR